MSSRQTASRARAVSLVRVASRLVAAGTLAMALFAQSAMADVPGDLFGAPNRGFSPASPAISATPGDGGGRTGQSTNTGPTPSTRPPANAPAQPQLGSAPQAPSRGGTAPKLRFTCTTLNHHRGKLCRTFVGGKLTRSCVTRAQTRRCTYYSPSGRRLRVCKQRGKRRESCRRVAGSSAAKSPRKPVANRQRSKPRTRAQAAELLSHGTYNPAFASIVRFYCNNACTRNAHNGYCSGTLLKPGLVLTAAHCLYDNDASDGSVGYELNNENIVVTPGVDQRSLARFGNWGVARQYVPVSWQNGDQSQDWGIVVLTPDSSNHYAGDYAGMESAAWGVTIRQGDGIWNIGYPGDGPFNSPQFAYGDAQSFCWSRTSLGTVSDPSGVQHWTLVRDCDMNRGSSGGPVFARVGSAWYVVGVNNTATFRIDGYAATNTSVWMDSRFGQFWNAVLADVQRSGL